MSRRPALKHTDLRGATRLATDATTALADLVEAMHAGIVRAPDGRTGGITGLVYKSIRGVTRLAGGSLEALLGLLQPALASDAAHGSPEREAVVAALNGVMGDYLAASANPLAIPMTLRRAGRVLPLERAALAADPQARGGRLLVLLHGLCMNDLQWRRAGHDHGQMLAEALGYTPLYLHYNSGQHISLNGRAFAQTLEQLLAAWPQPVERLVLLGHSMGGLLMRSAMQQGAAAGQAWVGRVDDLVFLGTPHHGAPLERAGNWVTLLLGAAPYAAPLARLGKLRSAGITDLRHSSLLDEDWVGRDRFAHGPHRPRPVPLPEGPRCYALAASTGRRNGDLKDKLLGDGLVPLDSALGRHADPARCLKFAPERQWQGWELNHLDLLSSPQVAEQLRLWLAQ